VPTVTPRVAFYERVSTDEQSKRDTIASQDKRLHKTYDWRFGEGSIEPWIFAGTFRDDGISGTIPLDERPDGSRLMTLIRHGQVDIVCVAAGDRLARDRGVAEQIAKEFSGREILIKAPSETIDLSTPTGQLQFAIMAAFGHFERQNIRVRTMSGRANHAERGDWINGPVPFGYVIAAQPNGDFWLAPSDRTIPELGCTEAELVQQIFERTAGTEDRKAESLLSVKRWLQATGIPSVKRYFSKKSGQYRSITYPCWQYSKLQDIVQNTTYYGERTLKFHTIESNEYKQTAAPVVQIVPALVSRELWERAKSARGGHRANFERRREEEYVYLLTGKLICSHCNVHMRGNYQKTSSARSVAKFYYVCNRHPTLEPGRSIRGEQLEEQILQEFDAIAAAPERVLAKLREQQFEQHGSIGAQDARMHALRKRLAGFERGRSGLAALVSSGELSADEFRTQTADNARQAADVRRELEILESEDALAEALLGQIHDAESSVRVVAEEWPKIRAAGTRSAMRAFMQPLIQRVVVYPDRIEASILTIVSRQTHDEAQSNEYASIVSPLYWNRSFARVAS
jgi:site-specific DNA recombinase